MSLIKNLREKPPLIVCITNDVVKNFTANGLIALGASPIMSGEKDEAESLMKVADGLLINIGTADVHKKELMSEMIAQANKNDVPVVLDPVGYGASSFRKSLVDELIERYNIDFIKGNRSEMLALSGEESTSRGVDSTEESDALEIAENTFSKYRIPVLVTGETDGVVTHDQKYTLHNGHSMQGKITGSGCLLGAVILGFIAKNNDVNNAVVNAVSYYNLCAESAAQNNTAGPGTFLPNYIDALYLNDDAILKDKVVKIHE